jgi:hypothetical protein
VLVDPLLLLTPLRRGLELFNGYDEILVLCAGCFVHSAA